jgi:hypothetical protein
VSKTFQSRLFICLARGNLRTADLARWFDRSHATVRGWIDDGRKPVGGPGDVDHVHALLDLLETLIRQGRGFPVPRLSPSARIKYLQDIRKAVMP